MLALDDEWVVRQAPSTYWAQFYYRYEISQWYWRPALGYSPIWVWNCEAERGSTRSSFNTTICVLEALLEYELAGGTNNNVKKARLRGQEYLLERRLFHRLSTGEVIERNREGSITFTRFAFPTWWHYDILRGLDYLRRASVTPDERVADAIDLVESKRGGDGRWLLEVQYPGKMPIEMDQDEGSPSRWNTLHALRVLDWYSERG